MPKNEIGSGLKKKGRFIKGYPRERDDESIIKKEREREKKIERGRRQAAKKKVQEI